MTGMGRTGWIQTLMISTSGVCVRERLQSCGDKGMSQLCGWGWGPGSVACMPAYQCESTNWDIVYNRRALDQAMGHGQHLSSCHQCVSQADDTRCSSWRTFCWPYVATLIQHSASTRVWRSR